MAIVLTLLIAGTLNDLTSTSTSGSPPATPPAVQLTTTGAGWNLNPFTNLLRSPVRAPWTAGL